MVRNGTTSREWRVVRIEASPSAAESVASLLTEVTGRGVALDEADRAVIITGYMLDCEAGALEQGLRQRLAELAANLGAGATFPLSIASVPEEDWTVAWRDSYRPVRVGRRLVVKPSWHSWPPPDGAMPAFDDDLVIEIDPQMAFGTGAHETTQLSLAALEDLIQPGCSVADVGCGTGILSIAAAKLGAGEVLAVDNDPLAVEIARQNVAHNSVADRVSVQVGDGLSNLERRFDLIVANINTPVIVALSSSLAAHLAGGGSIAVCGIPTVRAPRVASVLRQGGLWVEEVRTQGTWVCVVAQRRTNRQVHLPSDKT